MGTGFQLDETKVPTVTTGASEKKYQAILMALRENVVTLDAEGRIQYINHVSPGLDERQMLGSNWLTWLEETDRPIAMRAIEHTRTTGETTEIEFRAIGPQREMTWFQVSFTRLVLDATPSILLIAQDITERKIATSRHRQITRLYATLSQINQSIVRVKEPPELYRAICEVSVQYGEFTLAWIGILERATGRIIPVAHAGANEGYVESLHSNLNDPATGYGPTGMAIRTGKIKTSDDIQTDIAVQSWREHALARDFRASISVPFRLQGETIGALNLYVREPFFFSSPEEIKLLEEISWDISFALDAMQIEAERKRTEDALRESEQKWSVAFAKAPYASTLSVIPSATLLDVNEAFEKIFGYTKQDAIGKTPAELGINPETLEHRARIAQELQTRPSLCDIEYDLVTKAGEVRNCLVNMNVIHVAGQDYLLQSIQDITERKRFELELAETRTLFQKMFELGPVAASFSRLHDRTVLNMNAALEQMVGYTRDEVIGRSSTQLDYWVDATERQRAFAAFVEQQRVQNYEFQFRTKQGNIGDALLSAEEIEQRGEKYMLAMYVDITERKRAEQALRESEARYRLIADNTADVIWVLDPIAGKFTYVSPSVEKLRGYTPAQVMAQPVSESLTPASLKFISDSLAENLPPFIAKGSGTVSFVTEIDQPRKDGSIVQTEVTTTYMFNERGQVEIVGVSRDITERKHIENELRKSRERYQNFVQQSYEAIYCTEFDKPIDTTLPIEEQIDAIYQNAYMGECNQAMATMYGLPSPDAFIGQRMIDSHGGKDNPVNRTTFRQFIEGNYRALNVETEEITPEGERRWFISNNMGVVENGRLLRIWGMSLDITDRKRAEAILHESEEKFRLFVEHAPAAMAMLDRDLNYLAVSRRWMQGYRLTGDIVGRNHYEVFPEIPERWKIVHRRCLAGAIERAEEDRFDRADGSVNWVKWEIHPWFDRTGNIGGIVIFSEDITERKYAEQSLRDSEERLELVMEGSQLGYWDWNIETGQVHRNARWAEMLGYTLEEIELSVKQWTDLHHPDDRARAWQSVQDHLEGRAPAHRCEYRMLAKDGQYKWILDQARVVKRDANGKPLRMSGTHTDITERKRAEDSLRENEASLRESQRVAHIGHWSWDTQTNRVIWSDEMKRIFGLDPATFDGDLAQIIARAIHPEDRAQVDAANQAVLTVQKPAPIEYRVILPDQSVHTIWAVPGDKITNVGGKIVKLTGIVQDITERKQTEERIHRQVQQLDALRSIDTAISSNFSLSITLDILLKQVVSQLGVDAAAVLLFNPNLLVLEFAAGTGFRSPAIQQTKVRLSEGIAGRTAFERRMQNATLISNTARDFANRPGITDENFNTYFSVPLIAKGQIKGVLEVFHRAPLQANAEWLNFLEILSGQAAIAIDNVQLFERLQRSNLDLALAYDATIEGWSRALDLRDKETEGHTQRVVELTLTMARVLGIAEADLVHLRRGALLHDIGKLGVPDAILFKPGKLSDEEMQIMRRHPVFAYEMLSPIAYLRPALDIPYCHHEKWDGTGYPRRLAGEQIPLAARIFAVVDVWDALCSDRPYRKGWDENQVREHIHSEIGTHFDPRVVEVFEKLIMLKHRSSCESIQ